RLAGSGVKKPAKRKRRSLGCVSSCFRKQDLPDLAPVLRPHHSLAGFAAKSLAELRQVGERANHSIFCHRVRIALNHYALRFRTRFVAAPLSPGDKELLVGRESVNGGCRMLLLRLLEGQIGNLGPCKIANALSQDEFAIMVDRGLDKVAVELAHNARGAFLEALEIVGRP